MKEAVPDQCGKDLTSFQLHELVLCFECAFQVDSAMH